MHTHIPIYTHKNALTRPHLRRQPGLDAHSAVVKLGGDGEVRLVQGALQLHQVCLRSVCRVRLLALGVLARQYNTRVYMLLMG